VTLGFALPLRAVIVNLCCCGTCFHQRLKRFSIPPWFDFAPLILSLMDDWRKGQTPCVRA
jgi:hypothetical protein